MNLENPKIELLPEHIIDQIKAGEVIERPSSLIKELIENSIDAKATKIECELQDVGLELISIVDNGHGMSFENLPYAFLRHATSKIKRFDDLYRLKSFGFRGEALASIAATSRVTCQSIPSNPAKSGGKYIISGGVEELHIPIEGKNSGTSFYIKDLFYNTPARLKFLKSKNSEKIAMKKIWQAFLLSHPEIEFRLKWIPSKEQSQQNKIEMDIAPVVATKKERAFSLFFPKINLDWCTTQSNSALEKLVNQYLAENHKTYDGHSIHILLSLAPIKNPSSRLQFLFANGRVFHDKGLHQAIIRQMEGPWNSNESGHYVAFIEAPTDEIDVNVHPNKIQIKFSKPDIIYSLISSATKEIKDQIQKDKHKSNVQDLIDHNLINSSENLSLDEKLEVTYQQAEHYFSPNSLINGHQEINQNPTSSMLSPVISIDHWLIYAIKEQYFFNSKQNILAEYLFMIIEQFRALKDEPVPLFISEPIKVSPQLDSILPILKESGFECDRLSVEIVALRTTPILMERKFLLWSISFLLEFFKYSADLDSSHLQKFWFKHDIERQVSEHIPSQVVFEKIILDILNRGHKIKSSQALSADKLARIYGN